MLLSDSQHCRIKKKNNAGPAKVALLYCHLLLSSRTGHVANPGILQCELSAVCIKYTQKDGHKNSRTTLSVSPEETNCCMEGNQEKVRELAIVKGRTECFKCAKFCVSYHIENYQLPF